MTLIPLAFLCVPDDVDQIWTNVVDLCVKTVLAVQPQLVSAYKRYVPPNSVLSTGACSVFEILGFDIMLDAGGAPWLIEINHAPSFKGTSKHDTACKKGVIQGAFEMLGVTEKRKRLLTQRVRKQWSAYMWDQARAKSKEKQTPQAAVTAAMTLAERDRRAWVKGSPAKRKALSVPRIPKSPDRTLPPLSRSSTPGGSGNRLSRVEFAAADPWRIVSRERGPSKAKVASGAATTAGAAAYATHGDSLARQPPITFSVHKRKNLTSGGSAKAMPGTGADRSDDDDDDDDDEDALLGVDDDEEEAEGLDVEDEDGEEVLETNINDDRLMNHGPSAVVQSLTIAGGVVQDHWKASDSNLSPATGETGETPLISHFPTNEVAGGAESAEVSSEGKKAESCGGPESAADDQDEGEAMVRPPHQYTAPTVDGPHGYIRIYSEMSQNDKDRYTDVIAAAARVFARTSRTDDTDGNEQDEEEEEEQAAAAEAEAAQCAGDDDDDDGGSRGVARPSSSPDSEWNVTSSVAYPSSHAFRDSDANGNTGSGVGELLAFGRKKKSKPKTLSGRD